MNNQEPLVSILIANFNKGPYLRSTLNSILNQTYQNWECIIVDDHSNDSSVSILNEFSAKDARFKILSRPSNYPKGANSCRNFAFEVSKGEFINWFDSDDLMDVEFIQYKLHHLQLLPSVDFVVSRMSLASETTFRPKASFNQVLIQIERPLDYFMKRVNFHTSGPMFRKDRLAGKELFNVKLKSGQEKEFYFRLLYVSKFRYEILDKVLTLRRESDNSIWTTIFREGKEKYLISRSEHILVCLGLLINHGEMLNKAERRFLTGKLKSILWSGLTSGKILYSFRVFYYLVRVSLLMQIKFI